MATDDFFLLENSALTFTFILLVLLIFSVSLFAVDLYWKCHPPKAPEPRPSSDPNVMITTLNKFVLFNQIASGWVVSRSRTSSTSLKRLAKKTPKDQQNTLPGFLVYDFKMYVILRCTSTCPLPTRQPSMSHLVTALLLSLEETLI